MAESALRLRIRGRVQGVGYRDWTVREAERRSVRGWVRNRSDGTVEALLIGDDAAVAAMAEACLRGPRAAAVSRIDSAPGEDDGSTGFRAVATL